MVTDIKKVILKDKNSSIFVSGDCLDFVASKLNQDVKIIIFKLIQTDKKDLEIAFKLRQLCSIFDSLLIIQKRADIVEIIDADGIYLTNEDMKISQAKKILHDDKFFMTSYENPDSDRVIEENYDNN